MNSIYDSALQKVALRHNAIYIHRSSVDNIPFSTLQSHTLYALGEFRKFGIALSERALRAFNTLEPAGQADIIKTLNAVYATEMNWTPLVRDWLTPTGQTWLDMAYTFLYNVADRVEGGNYPGTRLRCGHVIPDGVFDIERYTGCPFCGMPFETSDKVNYGGASELRVLDVMGDAAMDSLLRNLLEMRTPLDVSQLESLSVLLQRYNMPQGVQIPMKETLVAVMHFCITSGRPELLLGLVTSPGDVLRYLWFVHTGQLKVIRPKTLLNQTQDAWSQFCPALDESAKLVSERKKALRLHFTRKTGRIVAWLLNTMEMPAEEMCRIMHPRREMWVHMIRALHLPEYARRKGNGKLARLLDRFYRRDYLVTQGAIDKARLAYDFESTMQLLRLQPGVFARQLFANMLWFDAAKVLDRFRKVLPLLPTRLIIGLGNAAESYFSTEDKVRPVRIITGQVVKVEKNPLIYSHSDEALYDIVIMVKGLLTEALRMKYAVMPAPGKRHICIDPVLDDCAMPVSDRSISVQDVGSALPGMKFDIIGDKVRLFLYWGEGMPAQPLDLDLSAVIIYDDHSRTCNFSTLTVCGAQHSGDMRWIPDNVGTAEYVELDIPKLKASGAKYVMFSATNYSGGELPPNTRAGWMSSTQPMTVDDTTGVSFDPSCVQMMIRLPQNITGRTVHFGILDVESSKIIYIEVPDSEQVVGSSSAGAVMLLLKKLRDKLTLGGALRMMADAQGLEIVTADALADNPDLAADTLVYDASSLSNIPELMRTLLPD